MSPEVVAEIYRGALVTTVMLGTPVLGITLVVGTIISLLQAATQVNEMTLTFIPKAAGAAMTLYVTSGWLMDTWLNYTLEIYAMLETVSRGF